MAIFDSIINNDEWISDHYFTTDDKGATFTKRVRDRINEWKKDNPDSNPWERLRTRQAQIQKALVSLTLAGMNADKERADAALLLRTAFGYGETADVTIKRGETSYRFQAATGSNASVIAVDAVDADSVEDLLNVQVLSPVVISTSSREGTDKTIAMSASKLVSEIFLSHNPPNMVLVFAGGWVLLAERESWPLGRFLAFDVQLAAERNDQKQGGELQRFAVALARENTETAADGTTWWLETIEESRNHAVKVSEELRSAVKHSIEIIGNDVLTRYRAQGLADEIDNIDGNELAKQSLRYLYRILFLLFAEASPELNILPTGSPEYDEGYGLSRIRDLVLSPPATPQAEVGTHLYESLQLLFDLVNRGHDPEEKALNDHVADEGLTFRNLSADLFSPDATSYIDQVKLSNIALHKVLENLLLSSVKKGQDRGFVSYATLGVTELGQVYEGLMSYTGFIAQQDLIEVAPHGDPSKGSWVIPAGSDNDLPEDCYVYDEVPAELGGTEKVLRKHPRGSFVFRQSSRDRERSASFYTPEVLTSFTVSQGIEELRANGRISCAEDILTLTICEPAIGSGAYAVAAVRQLAELYLELRQEELGTTIDAAQRTEELQRVKAHIALHQVYGVDLNAMAVELAEISLWLDTMTAELKAPWFGLHLRRGNSLFGASHSTLSPQQLNEKKRWEIPATPRPLSELAEASESGESYRTQGIYHFLLPSEGWGSCADVKEAKNLAAEERKELADWRKLIRKFPSLPATIKENTKRKPQDAKHKTLYALQGLSQRVDTLWQIALWRIQEANRQTRRQISVWGHEANEDIGAVTRNQVEQYLHKNPNSAYARLKLVMDAWCALWYWPLLEQQRTIDGTFVDTPNADQWVAMLKDILGLPPTSTTSGRNAPTEGQIAFGDNPSWETLDNDEDTDWQFAGAKSVNDCLEKYPFLQVCKNIAKQQAFFHWELEYAHVFANGGFDLQVGNPPWVRPRSDEDALLAERDPWFALTSKATQTAKRERKEQILAHQPPAKSALLEGLSETTVLSNLLGDTANYPYLEKQQPDLYRGFIERCWDHMAKDGIVCLLHPESHFTEKKAAPLRKQCYQRLRRHWQFINELQLFDVHHLVAYGINTYGCIQTKPHFLHACSLYHPQTVIDSLIHNGEGQLPGLKDPNNNWDRRPHQDRIQRITVNELEVWKSILETDDIPAIESRMIYTVNSGVAHVLTHLSTLPRLESINLAFSAGWHETSDKKRGYFDVEWAHPKKWDDVILQGPHLGISCPLNKQPNPTLKNNLDWSEIDLEAIPEDFIPATSYQRAVDKTLYDSAYEKFAFGIRTRYQFTWRKMAAITGVRTLYGAILPPTSATTGSLMTGSYTGMIHDYDGVAAELLNGCPEEMTTLTGAILSSILADFVIRSTGVANIYPQSIERLPLPDKSVPKVKKLVVRRFLELNCLTSDYASLWNSIEKDQWSSDSPLRLAEWRRKAQIEIDVALSLGFRMSIDDLCMIYRTQFPVMYKYDQEDHFDANGRKVPKDILKLEKKNPGQLSDKERSWTHPQSGVEYLFEYPFRVLDREADMREAYARLEKEFGHG